MISQIVVPILNAIRDIVVNAKDSISNAITIIDYAHHEIHSGSMFRVQAFDNAIGAGATLAIGFKTGNVEKQPHFVFEWETESTGDIELLEDVSLTLTSGTDVLIKRSNRPSSKESTIQGCETGAWVKNYVTKNPTIAGGNIISKKLIYSNSKACGGDGLRRGEIILKESTEYAIVFTNSDTSAKGAQIRLEWYEHTPK